MRCKIKKARTREIRASGEDEDADGGCLPKLLRRRRAVPHVAVPLNVAPTLPCFPQRCLTAPSTVEITRCGRHPTGRLDHLRGRDVFSTNIEDHAGRCSHVQAPLISASCRDWAEHTEPEHTEWVEFRGATHLFSGSDTRSGARCARLNRVFLRHDRCEG